MASKTSSKRALKDVNGAGKDAGAGGGPASKKPKSISDVRAKDIVVIKSILGDIKDPVVKSALERIIKNPTNAVGATNAVATKKDEATLEKLTNVTVRTIQNLVNEKLKWKSSFQRLKGGGKQGARVEVACTEPEVFERIFKGAEIKRGKDGKLSWAVNTDEEVQEYRNFPFKGKSYRYNSSELVAPCAASLKDGKLTFRFKYTIW
ncbi:hypothetical protein ACHAWF_013070 [Thalassiosira exigua]